MCGGRLKQSMPDPLPHAAPPRATCDWVARALEALDVEVGCYHAGKDSAVRARWATPSAGRGAPGGLLPLSSKPITHSLYL